MTSDLENITPEHLHPANSIEMNLKILGKKTDAEVMTYSYKVRNDKSFMLRYGPYELNLRIIEWDNLTNTIKQLKEILKAYNNSINIIKINHKDIISFTGTTQGEEETIYIFGKFLYDILGPKANIKVRKEEGLSLVIYPPDHKQTSPDTPPISPPNIG